MFYLFRFFGPNPIGSSSSSRNISYWSLPVARMIWNSFGSQNSIITWRQTPHGAAYSLSSLFIPPTTQIASNSRTPSLTAWKMRFSPHSCLEYNRHFQCYSHRKHSHSSQATPLPHENVNTAHRNNPSYWLLFRSVHESVFLPVFSFSYQTPYS